MKAQTKWSWLIAAYLFLAGVGGGAFVTGAVSDFAGWSEELSRIGILLGFPCVLVGTVFLIFDLGNPKNFWRAYARPGTSWIARGTIIITIFMVVNFLYIVLWIWPFPEVIGASIPLKNFFNIFGSIFAFGTMIYTGILLGASRPIAFWSTAMLPLLFLVSAMSTGIMAVMLTSIISGSGVELSQLAIWEKIDAQLIVIEIFILLFYLQGTHRVPESRASARFVLKGSVAPLFWIGVVLLGILIPLLLEIGIFGHSNTILIVATTSGIIGGFCLRQVVLSGGIHAPLKSGRFEYYLTNV
ncbi:MAG: polysulfide reductase NrfD [Bacteroidetes bacterium]|nr:polysulfide reductase NrfD [Bacteroidota bacterium]MBL6963638.1 polysulfide reductase NrfD [Bacteroidota bacterium]